MITEAQVAPPEPPKRMRITFTRQHNVHPHGKLQERDEWYDGMIGWHLDPVAGYYFLTHIDGWTVGVPLEGRRVLLTPQD